jgi:hypothetical protein
MQEIRRSRWINPSVTWWNEVSADGLQARFGF